MGLFNNAKNATFKNIVMTNVTIQGKEMGAALVYQAEKCRFSNITVSGKTNGTSTVTAGALKGTATITITLKSGLKKTVKVTVQPTTVKTTKISGIPAGVTLKKGQSRVLQPVLAPVTSQEKVTYTSSKTSVAVVASNGKITAKAKGTAVITVKSGTKTVKCKVTVN